MNTSNNRTKSNIASVVEIPGSTQPMGHGFEGDHVLAPSAYRILGSNKGTAKKEAQQVVAPDVMPDYNSTLPRFLQELHAVFTPKHKIHLGGASPAPTVSPVNLRRERVMLWGGTMLLGFAALGLPMVPADALWASSGTSTALLNHPTTTKKSASAKTSYYKKKKAVSQRKATLAAHRKNVAQVRGKLDSFLGSKLEKMPADTFVRGWSYVIVRLDEKGLTPSRVEALTSPHGYVYRRLPLVNSVAVAIPNRYLLTVANQPFVVHMSADAPMAKSDAFTVQGSAADEAAADYGVTGEGVTVAVLDTGITHHEDLDGRCGSRVVEDVNFVPKKNGKVSPTTDDDCGHGTHIAGIIAGNGSASTGKKYTQTFMGIAPEASLVNIRVLDDQGQGTVSNVISGIDWAIKNRFRYNIRVLNISSGHEVGESYKTDPLCQAVEQAWSKGLVVVCAAGNGGRAFQNPKAKRDNEGYGTAYGSIQSPANSPSVITVGAMKRGSNRPNAPRTAAQIATYSSRGPSRLDFVLKPDIVAPGDSVVSTLSKNSYLEDAFDGQNQVSQSEYIRDGKDRPSRDYLRLSGTSMAAPVVSGAAALLLQRNPWMTPDMVKARLMLTANKCVFPNGDGDAATFGAGYINIAAALDSKAIATVPATSPTLTLNSDGTVTIDTSRILVRVVGGYSPFGTGMVGGSQAIWGGNAVRNIGLFTNSVSLNSAPVWSDSQVYAVSLTQVDLSSVAILGDR